MKELIVFNRNTLGEGPCDLGEILLVNFLKTLIKNCPGSTSADYNTNALPSAVILYNSGVLIGSNDSISTFPLLKELQTKGIDIIFCGTCVKYFKLEEKISIGRISNMQEILDKMQTADKVITP